jgi:hypothetical protein
MDLPGHLWRVLGLGRITVEVRFSPPLNIAEAAAAAGLGWGPEPDRATVAAARKALAERCRSAIVHGVAESLAGGRDAAPVLPRARGAAA